MIDFNDGHLRKLEALCRQPTAMTGDYIAAAITNNRHHEAKRSDTVGNLFDL